MGLLFALLDGAALGFVVYATARPHHVARMLGLTDHQSESEEGVEGLPEAQDDVVIIVSMGVRQALPDRKDLASPGSLRKDESGMPTGCYGLNFN